VIPEPDRSIHTPYENGIVSELQEIGLFFELGRLPSQHLFGALARTDVTDGATDEGACIGLERAQTDLDRKRATILAQPIQLQPCAHGSHARVAEVGDPVEGVVAVKVLRHQHLDWLADQLRPHIAKQLLSLGINQHDHTVAVDNHHGIRRRLEQGAELILCQLPIGDVANGTGDEETRAGCKRAQANLDRERAAILAPGGKIEATAHRPGARRGDVCATVLHMESVQVIGEQHLDWLPEQLGALVAKQLLDLIIDNHDTSGGVDDHDRVGGGVEQRLERDVGGELQGCGWCGEVCIPEQCVVFHSASPRDHGIRAGRAAQARDDRGFPLAGLLWWRHQLSQKRNGARYRLLHTESVGRFRCGKIQVRAMIPYILIIDTDPGAAQTTRALVARVAAAATVSVETTPERGRVSLRQHRADALIIDPAPYNLAAIQLLAWVTTEQPTICAIALASTVPWTVRRQIAALRIARYLEKHTDPKLLLEQLHGALDPILHAVPVELPPPRMSVGAERRSLHLAQEQGKR
jgi:hypothetical protein